MATIKLNITANSKPIPENLSIKIEDLSFENSGNGISILPKQEDFPMPWDAVCYIEDGFLILDGDMGQQGSHRGWAKTGIPLDKVSRYLDMSIYVKDDAYDAREEIEEIFTEYGWM